jgi:hypothetical protein
MLTVTRAAPSLVRDERSASLAPRQAASALANAPAPPSSRDRRVQAARSSVSTSAARALVSAAVPVVPRARAALGASSPKADAQSNDAMRSACPRSGQLGSPGFGGADAAADADPEAEADALASGVSSATQLPSTAWAPRPEAIAKR